MLKRLYPVLYVTSIFEIDYDSLYEQGIRGLIFDIDNTLVAYDVPVPTKQIESWFDMLGEKGFQVCLASNNTLERVVRFNESLKLHAVHKAKKPRRIHLRKVMGVMALDASQVAMIGDQIFTDVYGGNRAKMTTILVHPVTQKDEWMTKIKRGIERKVIARYERSSRR